MQHSNLQEWVFFTIRWYLAKFVLLFLVMNMEKLKVIYTEFYYTNSMKLFGRKPTHRVRTYPSYLLWKYLLPRGISVLFGRNTASMRVLLLHSRWFCICYCYYCWSFHIFIKNDYLFILSYVRLDSCPPILRFIDFYATIIASFFVCKWCSILKYDLLSFCI